MGSFLPATYSNEQWDKAKRILLKDGEVSEGELKIIAGDISSHIATKDDAKKFWTDWNTNLIDAMSQLGPEDVTVMEDLKRMQETVLNNLDMYYPAASLTTERGRINAQNAQNEEIANQISQNLFGVNFDELDESNPTEKEMMERVFQEFFKIEGGGYGGFGLGDLQPEPEPEPEPEPKKKLHETRRTGWISRNPLPIKDPVIKDFSSAEALSLIHI